MQAAYDSKQCSLDRQRDCTLSQPAVVAWPAAGATAAVHCCTHAGSAFATNLPVGAAAIKAAVWSGILAQPIDAPTIAGGKPISPGIETCAHRQAVKQHVSTLASPLGSEHAGMAGGISAVMIFMIMQ